MSQHRSKEEMAIKTLLLLKENGPMNITNLGDEIKTSYEMMKSIMSGLEKGEYVEKGDKNRYNLTKKGKSRLPALLKFLGELESLVI